ncbi:MAG: alpha/beta hydrolase [Deferribacterales bacterium]
MNMNAHAENPEGWDKTFDKSDKVQHQKVQYRNRYGITLVADMYSPLKMTAGRKYPALIVGAPYGGVKEQGPGRYAQEMAERGYVAIAFDPSYNGESGGYPRQVSSPDIFVEDFSAGVDFLGTRPYIDRERIGVIGICGSGAFSISAAAIDPRIKAVATVSMYDMTRVKAKGWMDSMTKEQRQEYLVKLGEQRWKEFDGAKPVTLGLPPAIDENTDPITREFYEYYLMPRGYHPRSTAHFTMTSDTAFMNFQLFNHIKEISPRPVLFIMGENAHSRYFTEDAYEMAAEPKELYIVKGAGHVDLYDKMDIIPFDKLESFFNTNLK